MRRIRRSAIPASLLAGVLLFGAAACDDGGTDDTGGTTDTTDTTGTGTEGDLGTDTGVTEDPLAPTETETTPAG